MANIVTDNIEVKKLRCLLVDDEPVAIDGLIHYITKLVSVSAILYSVLK